MIELGGIFSPSYFLPTGDEIMYAKTTDSCGPEKEPRYSVCSDIEKLFVAIDRACCAVATMETTLAFILVAEPDLCSVNDKVKENTPYRASSEMAQRVSAATKAIWELEVRIDDLSRRLDL